MNATTIRVKTEVGGYEDPRPNINSISWFSKDLTINSSWYAIYKEANINEIMKAGSGIEIKRIVDHLVWQNIEEMVNRQWRRVSDEEVRLNIETFSILIKYKYNTHNDGK